MLHKQERDANNLAYKQLTKVLHFAITDWRDNRQLMNILFNYSSLPHDITSN